MLDLCTNSTLAYTWQKYWVGKPKYWGEGKRC